MSRRQRVNEVGRERRRALRRVAPTSDSREELVALHDRLKLLEQLCYAQVRRINALQAQLDHLEARGK